MRVIVAGSRTVTDPHEVEQAIAASGFTVTEVVSGTARGVDVLGEAWAAARGVPVRRFPADWDRHGRAAGPIRNEAMAAYGEGLVAVWDGASRGTADMITRAQAHGLAVYVWLVARAAG